MRGHAQRKFCKRAERGEVGHLQSRAVRANNRQRQVAVGGRAAVPRNVLEHRQYAASEQPLGDRAGDRRDLRRRRAVSPVPDHRIGLAHRHVGKRQAVDVDADLMQVVCDQPAAEPGGAQACLFIPVV